MEDIQCARMFSRLWTASSVSFVLCGVTAFLDSLCAAAVGSACGGAVMFSPRSGWRRCAPSLDDARLLVPHWLSVWCYELWLCLAAVVGLVLSQPGFWLFRLHHHLLWQVTSLLPMLSVCWCPTVAMVGSGVVWWLGWVLPGCATYVDV